MRIVVPNLVWGLDQFTEEPGYQTPVGHVHENEQGYYLQLDLPGVKKDDLKISIEKGRMQLEAERKGPVTALFRKSFLLPDDVELERVEAQLTDGVLEVALPKKAAAQAHVIPVKEGGKESFFGRLTQKKD